MKPPGDKVKAVKEIRKELYLILYSLIKAFGEGLHPGKGKIEVTSYIEQICQLFKVKLPENPYKGYIDIWQNIRLARWQGFDKALQQVKEALEKAGIEAKDEDIR